MLQAYLLELDVGIWSGIKRKMEIAESHGLPMVTVSLKCSKQSFRQSTKTKRPIEGTNNAELWHLTIEKMCLEKGPGYQVFCLERAG